MFSDLSMKLAPVQSSNRGQKAFARPRLPLLWQFVSYQSVISDELPAQDWGGRGSPSTGWRCGWATPFGADPWRTARYLASFQNKESDSKRNLVVVALEPPPPFHPHIQPWNMVMFVSSKSNKKRNICVGIWRS